MKILFLSGHYPPNTKGGGEISTHLIARGLVERGHDVMVITEGESSEATLGGILVKRRPWGLTAKPLFEKRASRRMARELEGEFEHKKYDVIHAHDFRAALVLSEISPNLSTVATVRDYAQICGTTNNILADGRTCHCTLADIMQTQRIREASLLRKPFRAWQYWHNVGYRRQAFRKIENHIYISHAQLEVVREQQDLAGINATVIYNPVDPDYLSQPPRKGTPGVFLYAGRMEEYKGVGLLLKAWQKFVKQFPSAKLRLIGEGAQQAEYESFVNREGLQYSVAFAGRILPEKLMAAYDAAQIVVSPHTWVEPFGRTVVEAMARAKIVVAANHGGPAEIIQNNRTGLLFDKLSVESLVGALTKALTLPELPRREMQNAARAWVQENLTNAKIAQAHEALYQAL